MSERSRIANLALAALKLEIVNSKQIMTLRTNIMNSFGLQSSLWSGHISLGCYIICLESVIFNNESIGSTV